MRKLTLAATAVALAAISTQAEAARVQVLHGVIRYSQTEITEPARAERLLKRIERLSAQLCAPTAPTPLLAGLGKAAYACRHEAVAGAVRDLDAPLVIAAVERRLARPELAIR